MFIHLIGYLSDRKSLIQSLPLSTLSDTRLGIDAAFYLQQVLTDPTQPDFTREPFLAATGGIPLALAARVENDLRVLEKLRIKPVFVFPGLQPKKTSRMGGSAGANEYAEEMREKKEAWELYEQGQADKAEALFAARSGAGHWELTRSVLRMFRNRNVEFQVAPYTPWAQVRAIISYNSY